MKHSPSELTDQTRTVEARTRRPRRLARAAALTAAAMVPAGVAVLHATTAHAWGSLNHSETVLRATPPEAARRSRRRRVGKVAGLTAAVIGPAGIAVLHATAAYAWAAANHSETVLRTT